MIWGLLWLPVVLGYLAWSREPLEFPVPPERKIPLLVPLYLIAPALIWGFCQLSPPASLADYGLTLTSKFGLGLGLGFGLGLGGILLLVGFQIGVGGLIWSSPGDGSEVVNRPAYGLLIPVLLGLTLLIGIVEELVFRGFIVDQLHHDLNWGLTTVLACSLFAVLHLVWDGWTGLPQTPGLLIMAAVLIVARWADAGSLGLAAGLHSGWIFSLALVDNLPLQRQASFLPLWLVGRPGQPLTGGLALLLLLLTGAGLSLIR